MLHISMSHLFNDTDLIGFIRPTEIGTVKVLSRHKAELIEDYSIYDAITFVIRSFAAFAEEPLKSAAIEAEKHNFCERYREDLESIQQEINNNFKIYYKLNKDTVVHENS